jgi:hypothetical protein
MRTRRILSEEQPAEANTGGSKLVRRIAVSSVAAWHTAKCRPRKKAEVNN